MKQTWIAGIASVLLSMTGTAHAQSAPEHTSSSESASNVSAGSAHVENGVPISRLLATVAKKTGKSKGEVKRAIKRAGPSRRNERW